MFWGGERKKEPKGQGKIQANQKDQSSKGPYIHTTRASKKATTTKSGQETPAILPWAPELPPFSSCSSFFTSSVQMVINASQNSSFGPGKKNSNNNNNNKGGQTKRANNKTKQQTS
jgi:hypothetical protein